jgi:LAS superfamily LD-carboxypeptidase LdcB
MTRPSDPLAHIDTSKLNQEFLGMLLGLLGAAKAHGLVLVAQVPHGGFRSYEEQAALHDAYLHGGPRAASPGHSAHECGCAVDFLALRNGVVVSSSDAEEYRTLEELAPRYRCKTLRSIHDGGHVELSDWERFAA